MNDILIEQTEARVDHSKQWRLTDRTTSRSIIVTFDRDLETTMKVHRTFSFNRFESEQLNRLCPLVSELDANYTLNLDCETVGVAFMPLSSTQAKQLMTPAE
ncbi:hypothetical protein [Ligilactobacillus hohenheimensis]|uniref:hypothetical protein n=1 Tax=Ligilactobacillus hohenheimensis TaxID=2991832 RepID=UPI0024BB0659|nr:hypothetical protein [Ligilactobacillus hohenheimensis]